MRKTLRKLLLAMLVLGASATPYLGVATAEAAAPEGHCTTCGFYFLDICWIVIAEGDC